MQNVKTLDTSDLQGENNARGKNGSGVKLLAEGLSGGPGDAKEGDKACVAGKKTGRGIKREVKNVVMLNITQFELTKMLYSSGVLAKCNLTPSAKLFLWALCSHYNPNNETMFPSQQTISKKLGISEKSAQRAVKELKTCGLIDYETRRVNHYVFGEKFFELVKMGGDGGQNGGREGGQNVPLTNNHEKIKKQKENFSFKGFQWNDGPKQPNDKGYRKNYTQNRTYRGNYGYGQTENVKRRVPNAEETRKMLDENEKIRAMGFNPKEFSREDAYKWIKSVPKFWVVKSQLVKFLVKKYDFADFRYVLRCGKFCEDKI